MTPVPAPSEHLRRTWWLACALLGSAALTACGGGGGAGAPATAPSPSPAQAPSPTGPTQAPTPTPPATVLGVSPCAPSGVSGATDYTVGPGQTYAELTQVPWDTLKAGDTVRIFYRTTPYRTKFMVAAQGTANAPVRICGVRGPNNERPIIDGENAVTASTLSRQEYGSEATFEGTTLRDSDFHQQRSIIAIKRLATGTFQDFPSYVQIDGLNIRGAHPRHSFTDASGASKAYLAFGGCVWVDRGHNITIADNEISDCTNAIFSKSTDDGDFAVTKDLRIAGNYLWGSGYEGDANDDNFHQHTTYTQGVNVLIEFNRYGPLRTGAGGNSIKDRSAGTVIRYNYIEAGAHSIDLVEAEDFPATARALPSYRASMVYGNLLKNDSGARAIVHYGGDHFGSTPGANWGEDLFRKGTLYFFHNTVIGTGSGAVFRISTTDETVEAWNNVIYYTGTPSWRTPENDGVGSTWVKDGFLNLGKNWINSGWSLGQNSNGSPLQGAVTGTANLITGASAPVDLTTLLPLTGSAVLNAAVAGPSTAASYTVGHQFDPTSWAGTTRAAATALGARQ